MLLYSFKIETSLILGWIGKKNVNDGFFGEHYSLLYMMNDDLSLQ